MTVLVAGAGFFALAAPAGAQTYGGCHAAASSTTVSPGQTITVSGTGAVADATVVASIGDAVVGSGQSDSTGNFSFSATIPAGLSGTQTLSVNCGEAAGVDAITLTVGATTTTTAPLPVTGSSHTIPLTKLAVGLVAVGGIAVVVARRRSRSGNASV
jgi:hypothetical protein